jgi:hypothetical protein
MTAAKNPAAPAVKREAEEDWGRRQFCYFDLPQSRLSNRHSAILALLPALRGRISHLRHPQCSPAGGDALTDGPAPSLSGVRALEGRSEAADVPARCGPLMLFTFVRSGVMTADVRDELTPSPPWSVEDTGVCFVVEDGSGQKLGYVYYEKEPGPRSTAKMLTKDEAQFAVLKLCLILQLRFVLNPIITAHPAD